jgi:PIN domain nuclease of toxin-antitoxin system
VNRYVSDTHAFYWYLVDSPRLGPQADQAFNEADQGAAVIFVPAIVLAELYYMNVKLGRQLDFPSTLQHLQHSGQFVLLPFLPEETAEFEADQPVPEMHDRIIVGVARRLNAPLLTRDSQIVRSGLVVTVW